MNFILCLRMFRFSVTFWRFYVDIIKCIIYILFRCILYNFFYCVLNYDAYCQLSEWTTKQSSSTHMGRQLSASN